MEYDHTQKAPLHWLLVVPGTAMVVTAWYTPEPAWVAWLLSVVGAIMIALSLCFRWLRVHDDGDALAVAFGPIGLFHTRIPYAPMAEVEAARSILIDGWGIHFRPGAGWIWNLWGYDCVRLVARDGKAIRVGTDDVEGLLAFLRTKLQTPAPTREEVPA